MKNFLVFLMLLLPNMFITTSCNFDIDELAQSIDDARGTIRDGIDRLGNESEKWRDIVEKDIIPLIDKRLDWVIADLQTLLSSTVANSISGLNCTADSLPLKIKRGLNDVLSSLDGKKRSNFIYPTVCTVSLNTIDMTKPASQRRQITLSGYDFIHSDDFEMWLVKNNNQEQFVQGKLTVQIAGIMILDLTNMDPALKQSKKLIVRHKDEILVEIPILQ